jgi:hypothetical protein
MPKINPVAADTENANKGDHQVTMVRVQDKILH